MDKYYCFGKENVVCEKVDFIGKIDGMRWFWLLIFLCYWLEYFFGIFIIVLVVLSFDGVLDIFLIIILIILWGWRILWWFIWLLGDGVVGFFVFGVRRRVFVGSLSGDVFFELIWIVCLGVGCFLRVWRC